MAEKQLDAAAAAALSGTTDSRTGLVYPTADADPWLVAMYRALSQLSLVADAANNLRVYADDSAGTTIGVRPGRCTVSSVVLAYAGGTVAGLTNNDVTYVWAYNNAGSLAIGAAIDGTGWPGVVHIKLAEVTIAAGVVTAILDRRLERMLAS